MRFKKSITLGFLAVLFYVLSYIFYYKINLGVNKCASACPTPGIGHTLGIILIPITILMAVILYKPLKNRNVGKNLRLSGIILKSFLIIAFIILLILLIRSFFEIYFGRQLCPQVCVTSIIPHPLSEWMFLLGSICLFLFVYSFFKELRMKIGKK